MIKIISLVGKPGVGKSTLSQHLESYCGWKRISTGEILRREATLSTPRGKLIKEILDKGEYVPTSIMGKIIFEQLKAFDSLTNIPEQIVVFDGFPRAADQCGFLEELVRRYNLPVDFFAVVRLTGLSNEELFDRVSRRLICSDPKCGKVYANSSERKKCSCGKDLVLREDDTFELFSKRMSIFECYEDEIVAYYKHFGRLFEINAKSDIETMRAEMRFILWTSAQDPMCRNFSGKIESIFKP